jgi:hypothetical protein
MLKLDGEMCKSLADRADSLAKRFDAFCSKKDAEPLKGGNPGGVRQASADIREHKKALANPNLSASERKRNEEGLKESEAWLSRAQKGYL